MTEGAPARASPPPGPFGRTIKRNPTQFVCLLNSSALSATCLQPGPLAKRQVQIKVRIIFSQFGQFARSASSTSATINTMATFNTLNERHRTRDLQWRPIPVRAISMTWPRGGHRQERQTEAESTDSVQQLAIGASASAQTNKYI